ncbi:Uncharacterized protein HZ326_16390 [Fusarium oxysporum f. sp. albedinis]|nr:Uncharacterized protein HZ326_16390 [Fusarium oxysporum f. sp. albedinis]
MGYERLFLIELVFKDWLRFDAYGTLNNRQCSGIYAYLKLLSIPGTKPDAVKRPQITMRVKLGSSLPSGDKHVINLDHIAKDPELIAQLKTGYPRFFVPLVVDELAERLLTWTSELPSRFLTTEFRDELRQSLKERGRSAMLLTACCYAKDLQGYLERQRMRAFVFVVDFDGNIRPVKKSENGSDLNEIYVVVYPQQGEKEAKAFWQHTGYGISKAKIAMQQRIADSLSTKDNKLKNSDVLLYPTGMSDISHIHDIISLYTTARKRTVAIFGKIHGYECKLYDATQSDLETLEEDLASGLQLWALFTEFPGNPLLGSVDLERIERIYDEYDFLFVVDDTVGTSVNVDVISHCDIVCTGLTKMFSGRCNVMGGSVALKPNGGARWDIKRRLKDRYINTNFPLDTIVMEKNSADRFRRASYQSQSKCTTHRRYTSQAQFGWARKGYGYLLSIRFKTPAAAIAFHDALDVAKGPSLGTNFTLGCAYTLFAHYDELEWAEEYGVVKHLVRISVGIENERFLDEVIKTALDAAERASKKRKGCCDLTRRDVS